MGSSNSREGTEALQAMQRLEMSHGKSDLILVVQDTHFSVHKTVLKEHSLYFRAMLDNFRESREQVIEIGNVCHPKLFAQALQYMYSKRIRLRSSSVQSLLWLSLYLQMRSLEQECCCFIEKRVDSNNCVHLLNHSQNVGPMRLQQFIENFVASHFEAVIKQNSDFLALNKQQLLRLLNNEHLIVTKEVIIHQAIMKWVKHDVENRKDELERLLQHVQLVLMTQSELRSMLNEPLIRRHVNLDILNLPNTNENSLDANKFRNWANKRRPRRWPKLMVVLRLYWRNLPIHIYDFESRKWSLGASNEAWRACAAVVSHNNCVYVIGGELEVVPGGKKHTVNVVSKLDVEKNEWSNVNCMRMARRWAAAAVVDGRLVVAGGIGGRAGQREQRLNDVEILDLENNESNNETDLNNESDLSKEINGSQESKSWSMCTPMYSARSSASAASLMSAMYVVGGGDNVGWLNSAEKYCPVKDTWQPIKSLNIQRWKCGLVALNNNLYAIGGMHSSSPGIWGEPLNSVEKYCPLEDNWVHVSNMKEHRFGCDVVAYRNKLYVAGGFGKDRSVLNSVEIYDPQKDVWSLAEDMGEMKGFVGACLIDKPLQRMISNQ